MSNVGKWDRLYRAVVDPEPYGLTPTYEMGVEWLAPCDWIEDWGCGKGWVRTLVTPERYRGIDGSQSPFADEIVDLAEYRSEAPGIFMRHVLEHDFRWPAILDNALASVTERMVLVLFTPFADETHNVMWGAPQVPNLSFRREDLTERMDAAGMTYSEVSLKSPRAAFNEETVFRLERP